MQPSHTFLVASGLVLLLLITALVRALYEVIKGRAALADEQKKELAAKEARSAEEDAAAIKSIASPDGAEREVLWSMFQAHLGTAHHHEEQRERVTALFLVLEVGLLGLLAFKDGEAQVVPPVYITLFISMLGIFGALFSLKHYERYRFHTVVAGRYRSELDRFVPLAQAGKIFLEVKDKQGIEYTYLSRMHLFLHWTALHLGVAALGVVLSGVLFVKAQEPRRVEPPNVESFKQVALSGRERGRATILSSA